jgi:hypothetical protein
MKAEQRKQLEQNELVARLTRWWKGDGTGKSSTTTWAVVGVIVLVVVLIFAWRYYSESSAKTRSALWGELQLAAETSQLEQIVESNRGTPTARAAKAQLARGWLQDGMSKLGSEFFRPTAIENVEKARKAYDELLKESTDDPPFQREALLALAKAEESLVGVPKKDNAAEDRGSLEKALELYRELESKHKESMQGKIAAERAAEIQKNKQEILTFYKELHTSLARREAPTAPELPPITPPKFDIPKFDPPFINPPKTEGPVIEPPKSDVPKSSAPAPTPKTDSKKDDSKAEPKKDGKAPDPPKSEKTK